MKVESRAVKAAMPGVLLDAVNMLVYWQLLVPSTSR